MTTLFPLTSLSLANEQTPLLPAASRLVKTNGANKYSPLTTSIDDFVPPNFVFADNTPLVYSEPFHVIGKYIGLHTSAVIILQISTETPLYKTYGKLKPFKLLPNGKEALLLLANNYSFLCLMELGATYRITLRLASRGCPFRMIDKEKV